MRKGFLAVFLIAALSIALGLGACSTGNGASSSNSSSSSSSADSAAKSETEVDGSAYGYAGTDPVEAAVYKYLVEEVGAHFDKADASIPIVNIVHVDYTNPDEVLVYGDFWVENYDIEGDTLMCVSGGDFPGVMHVCKDGDGYNVSSFDMVGDGSDFDPSAKQLFGEHYDAFMKVYGDVEARNELRTITVSDYVNLNGLAVTQYQDYGWEPVKLYK